MKPRKLTKCLPNKLQQADVNFLFSSQQQQEPIRLNTVVKK